MRFLLDHDVPEEIAPCLRYWDHAVKTLREVLSPKTPDSKVFAEAQQSNRILLTCNRAHFLALARHALEPGADMAGLVVLIRRRPRQAECAHLLALLRRTGETGLVGNINLA